MKKLIALFLALVCVLGLVACSANDNENSKSQTEIKNNPATENNDAPVPAPTENETEYGCLQELVDTYGFPICLRMTEGMELTEIEISENTAERVWMSNNEHTVHENLMWSIDGNHLVISGDWEEEFSINAETGRAVSALNGKEYKIVIYDEDGNPAFFIP